MLYLSRTLSHPRDSDFCYVTMHQPIANFGPYQYQYPTFPIRLAFPRPNLKPIQTGPPPTQQQPSLPFPSLYFTNCNNIWTPLQSVANAIAGAPWYLTSLATSYLTPMTSSPKPTPSCSHLRGCRSRCITPLQQNPNASEMDWFLWITSSLYRPNPLIHNTNIHQKTAFWSHDKPFSFQHN